MIEKGYYPSYFQYIEFSKQEIEESENIINEFPEIKKLVYSNGHECYYIDIKVTRKLKLLSLHDNELKLKFIKLEKLLSNNKLIQISEEGGFIGTSGTSGYSSYSGTSGIGN